MSLYRLDEVPEEKLTSTLRRKLVVGKNEMLSFLYTKKGCFVESHKHVHEQFTYILKGKLRMVVGGKVFVLEKGDILHILPNQAHNAEALANSDVLDIFTPIREDFLRKTDYYLRKELPGPVMGRQGRKARRKGERSEKRRK